MTCRLSASGSLCRGCKLGYDNGERDIDKAKCRIKLCCFGDKQLETCADCDEYTNCDIIQGLYEKSGYKYRKYQQAIDFIKANGYDRFLKIADTWKGPYGKFD
ncbi:DUF3795 domain-containing protein [Chloroflexota bacterium]